MVGEKANKHINKNTHKQHLHKHMNQQHALQHRKPRLKSLIALLCANPLS